MLQLSSLVSTRLISTRYLRFAHVPQNIASFLTMHVLLRSETLFTLKRKREYRRISSKTFSFEKISTIQDYFEFQPVILQFFSLLKINMSLHTYLLLNYKAHCSCLEFIINRVGTCSVVRDNVLGRIFYFYG